MSNMLLGMILVCYSIDVASGWCHTVINLPILCFNLHWIPLASLSRPELSLIDEASYGAKS